MSKNPNCKSNDIGNEEEEEDDDDDVDDDVDDGHNNKTLRRGCCVKRLTRHMARVPFEGGEGRGVPFSWSFKDKGVQPAPLLRKIKLKVARWEAAGSRRSDPLARNSKHQTPTELHFGQNQNADMYCGCIDVLRKTPVRWLPSQQLTLRTF